MPSAFSSQGYDPTGSIASATSGLTFSGDPAMIQMQGSVQSALAFAEAEALRRQRELLIQFGDPELAARYLGVQGLEAQQAPAQDEDVYSYAAGDKLYRQLASPWSKYMKGQKPKPGVDPTVLAAQANPFSVLKELAHGFEQNKRATREGLNKANLWYSGEHERQLGELGRDFLSQRQHAAESIQAALGDIQANLQIARLDAQQQRANQILQSEQGALNRALGG